MDTLLLQTFRYYAQKLQPRTADKLLLPERTVMSWINCWAMFSSCGGWGRPVNTTTKNNKNSSYHRDIQTPSQRQKFTIFFLENYAQNWKVLETESKTSYVYTTIKQTKDKLNRYYKGLCKWLHESSYWKVLLTTKRRRSWWGSWALRSNIPRFCVKKTSKQGKTVITSKSLTGVSNRWQLR